MNNLSFKQTTKKETKNVSNLNEKSNNKNSEELKELISKFKKDFYIALDSVEKLNEIYKKKEIHDAAISIRSAEKSVELI